MEDSEKLRVNNKDLENRNLEIQKELEEVRTCFNVVLSQNLVCERLQLFLV